MDQKKLNKEAPFHAWDCITLQVRGKWDVNIIIPHEKMMSMFLKLLIHHMESMDGQRGTSTKFKEMLMKNELKKLRKQGIKKVDEEKMAQLKK